MREPGYYWVRNKYGEWFISEWYNLNIGDENRYYWIITGIDIEYFDKDFTEIDERKIVREEPEEMEWSDMRDQGMIIYEDKPHD